MRGDEDDDVENDDVEEEDDDDVGTLMLRRRTDPKTEDHTLCEPAQSKYMSTFHKQTRLSPERGHTFCASLRSRNACQDFTRATLCGKMPRPRTTVQTLCEPARLKRTSRFHKSHLTLCGTQRGNLQENCRCPD